MSAPPTPPAEEKKKGKENFWFLLPRPKGADEARRLVLTRIILEKSSDFVQETQSSFKIRFFAKIRSVVKRRSESWRKNEFYFGAVSPEQNPNFFPTKSRYGMNRSATASLHSATPKKNVPCFSLVVVVRFFLKKKRTFFFGALPSRSRAGGGTIQTKFCKNYFLGEGFCKTSAYLFLNSDVANEKFLPKPQYERIYWVTGEPMESLPPTWCPAPKQSLAWNKLR